MRKLVKPVAETPIPVALLLAFALTAIYCSVLTLVVGRS